MVNMEVVVITGIGGMGMAIARRLGVGRQLVLADVDGKRIDSAAATLAAEGYAVRPEQVDVSDQASVERLASVAAKAGRLRTVVHTAGLSPAMASAKSVLAVDLAGTVYMIDAFLPHVEAGTVGVFIASMASIFFPLEPEMEQALACTPADAIGGLLGTLAENPDPTVAYGIAKRANQLRVQAAATSWGRRGGRIVSISPGIIATPMSRLEMESQPMMEQMLAVSPVKRMGSPMDIANAVDWLAGPAASFITGTDILVDGGVVAALRWPAGK